MHCPFDTDNMVHTKPGQFVGTLIFLFRNFGLVPRVSTQVFW